MTASFLHVADVHLGLKQYGSSVRFDDFGRSFRTVADYAIEHQVDFVIIAGDLFDKATINPLTLLQAVDALEELRQAHIQIVAIAGNHDRARYRDDISWLDYLSERGYMALLRPTFRDEGIELIPWNGREGGFIDIKGIRIVGVPYLGSGIHAILEDLADAISQNHDPSIAFTILTLHAGISGEMPRITGGLTRNELARLREHVDYLALGHLHKPFVRDGWIYNPGSLETCGMDERRWHGGCYHVTVPDPDPSNPEDNHRAKHIRHQRRAFYRLDFAVDDYMHFDELLEAIRQQLKIEAGLFESGNLTPVLEISLTGVTHFDSSHLDLIVIQGMANEILALDIPLRIRNATRLRDSDIPYIEHGSRAELERAILKELVSRDSHYDQVADEMSDLIGEVKKEVLASNSPDLIVAHLQKWLVDRAKTLDQPVETSVAEKITDAGPGED